MVISNENWWKYDQIAQNVAYTTIRAFNDINAAHLLRGRTTCRYAVLANFFDCILVIWIKNGRYSVFQSPNGDDKR